MIATIDNAKSTPLRMSAKRFEMNTSSEQGYMYYSIKC